MYPALVELPPRTLLACVILAACGGGGGDDDGDVLDQLAALPDLLDVQEWIPPEDFPAEPGYRYFDLWFEEPVDHRDAASETFPLYAALMHRDADGPLVVYTSGYGAGRTRFLSEPAAIVDGNQISLEYRFYRTSRPPEIPWPLLRSAQAVADHHAIVEGLEAIYPGPVIATGGSKGGEHALELRHLHPETFDATVAYVAPVITDLPDLRYAGVLDAIGTPACRDALRAAQRAMLERRAAMEERAALEATYEIAGVAHAVETAIVELEFAFWMTRGEPDCGAVPATTADDATLYQFLAETSWPGAYGDEDLADYGTQYLYQDMVELGYPVWQHAHLDDLMQFEYEDWSAYLPPGEPIVYDPSAPRALADWLETDAERVMLVLGEWDPWSPGAPAGLGGDDSHRLVVPRGSHWSSRIETLPAEEQALAIDAVRRWAGVSARQPGRPFRDLRNAKSSLRVPGP